MAPSSVMFTDNASPFGFILDSSQFFLSTIIRNYFISCSTAQGANASLATVTVGDVFAIEFENVSLHPGPDVIKLFCPQFTNFCN